MDASVLLVDRRCQSISHCYCSILLFRRDLLTKVYFINSCYVKRSSDIHIPCCEMKLILLAVTFGGVAFIGESPMASADDVTQTKTVINSEAVGGDLTQCIIQSNAITFKNAQTSAGTTSFTFRDVTQTSTLSNSGAVGGELVQYIIHVNGLTHDSKAINFVERLVVNGDAALTLTGPASVGQDSTSVGSSSNVFRDVTQTSTLSNSGAITGDLIQYIIHINGMNTNQLQNIADSAGGEIIHQLLKKLVDKMSVNGI